MTGCPSITIILVTLILYISSISDRLVFVILFSANLIASYLAQPIQA